MNAPEYKILESVNDMWGVEFHPAGCLTCKQVFLVHADQQALPCPNCGQSRLTPQSAWLRPAAPELVVPFSPTLPARLNTIVEDFVKGLWLKPDDFNTATLISRMRPIYWTTWLVDSQMVGSWKAEAGFDYQVKSSQESYGNGEWQTQEFLETRVRWEMRVGQLNRLYQNISVPGYSRHNQRIALTGDYDTHQAKAYHPSSIGQALVQIPDQQPDEILERAQDLFNQVAAFEVQTACSAQHLRNFIPDASYEALNWTEMLLPLYSSFYADDEGRYHPVFINGQTGQIGGVRLASQRKGWQWAGILAGAALVCLLVSLAIFFLGAVFPPIGIIGLIALVAAFGLGIGAIFPAVYPWQQNRGQEELFQNSSQSSGEVKK